MSFSQQNQGTNTNKSGHVGVPKETNLDDNKIQQSILELQAQLQSFMQRENELNYQQKDPFLKSCRTLTNKIYSDLQTLNIEFIKKSDDKNLSLRLSRLYSEQNRRLQRLEQAIREQGELQTETQNEDDGLLQQQTIEDVDFQVNQNINDQKILEDNVSDRKRRLQNAHIKMNTVKNVFAQIAEVASQQVDQMLTIDNNFSYSENKTKEASKELLKAQSTQRQNLSQRLVIILVLIAAIIGMLFIISK